MPDSPNGQVIWTLKSADVKKMNMIFMSPWSSYPGQETPILSLLVSGCELVAIFASKKTDGTLTWLRRHESRDSIRLKIISEASSNETISLNYHLIDPDS